MIGIPTIKLFFHIHYYLLIHKLSKICYVFANGSSANIKFSKAQLSKMIEWGGSSLNEVTRLLIRGLETMPEFIHNKFKNVLKNKDKVFDTIRTVENSVKGIKSIKKNWSRGNSNW